MRSFSVFSSSSRACAKNFSAEKIFSLAMTIAMILAYGSADAQISGSVNIPNDYATLDLALTALNSQGVGDGGVTLSIAPGNDQLAPTGGYIIGSAGSSSLLLSTLSATNPLIIDCGGNTIQAGIQTTGSASDGIIKIIGADYVTIRNAHLIENPSNVPAAWGDPNTSTEWGIAFLNSSTTDGTNHCILEDNTITLTRDYSQAIGIYANSRHQAGTPGTSAQATTAEGSHNNHSVSNNTISNVATGILWVGSANTAAFDSNNTISQNDITNWGFSDTYNTNSLFTGYSSKSSAIFMSNQLDLVISNNTLESAPLQVQLGDVSSIRVDNDAFSSGPARNISITGNSIQMTIGSYNSGDYYGIACMGNAGSVFHVDISGNTISSADFQSEGTLTYFTGIRNGMSLSTLSINNNVIKGIQTSTTSGNVKGVYNSGNIGSSLSVSNNTFGTASTPFVVFNQYSSHNLNAIRIDGMGSLTSNVISNNEIRNVVYNASGNANQAMVLVSNGTAMNNVTQIENNSFVDLSFSTIGVLNLISVPYTVAATGTQTVQYNRIEGQLSKMGDSGSLTFIQTNASSVIGATIYHSNNNFSNVTVGGQTTIYGFLNNDGGTVNKLVQNNVFSNWTAQNGEIVAIRVNFGGSSGAGHQVTSNIIQHLTSNANVTGIRLESSIQNVNCSQNTISGLSSLGSSNVVGIETRAWLSTMTGNLIDSLSVNSGSVYGIYFNTNSLGNQPSVCSGNIIEHLSASDFSSQVVGINLEHVKNFNASMNIIRNLSASANQSVVAGVINSAEGAVLLERNVISELHAAGISSAVSGIQIAGGTSCTVQNNIIGLQNALEGGSTYGLSGVNVDAQTNMSVYIYNNTIRIWGESTSALASIGMMSSSQNAALIYLNNNVICSEVGNGENQPMALFLNSNGLYSNESNNNFFYAGTNGHIYSNGTDNASTIAEMRTIFNAADGVLDSDSQTDIASQLSAYWLSEDPMNPAFLHMNSNMLNHCNGTGKALAGLHSIYTQDVDGEERDVQYPDMGADEFACVNAGCTDALACNYNSSAFCNDHTCVFGGCTDINALNYDANAACENGTCQYSLEPCAFQVSVSGDHENYICQHNPTVLTVDALGEQGSIAWYLNGDLISGESSTSLTATQPGLYYAVLLQSACQSMSEAYSLVAVAPVEDPAMTTTYSNQYCIGGSAVIEPASGPYLSYLWSNGETTPSIIATSSGSYSVDLVDLNGCQFTSQIETVDLLSFPDPAICLVTSSDDASHCVVVWNVITNPHLVSYVIYRETDVQDQYAIVGEVPYGQTGRFEDVDANPAVQAYRYKLGLKDECNSISTPSAQHTSLHLSAMINTLTSVDLIWNSYEGLNFETYTIYRGADGPSMHLIASIANGMNAYTDLTATSDEPYYQIRIEGIECSEERSLVDIKSNVTVPIVIGVDELSTAISIYPNPAFDIINVNLSGQTEGASIKVYDASGRMVLTTRTTKNFVTLNSSAWAAGIYQLEITSDEGVVTRTKVAKH